MTDIIQSGKAYKILTDKSSKTYDKISFWKKASDVYNDNGQNLQTTVGMITGISSSLTTESSTLAASASAVKQLNDKIEIELNKKNDEINQLNDKVNNCNAAASDVTSGKTFSSKVGFNIKGTLNDWRNLIQDGTVQTDTDYAYISPKNDARVDSTTKFRAPLSSISGTSFKISLVFNPDITTTGSEGSSYQLSHFNLINVSNYAKMYIRTVRKPSGGKVNIGGWDSTANGLFPNTGTIQKNILPLNTDINISSWTVGQFVLLGEADNIETEITEFEIEFKL